MSVFMRLTATVLCMAAVVGCSRNQDNSTDASVEVVDEGKKVSIDFPGAVGGQVRTGEDLKLPPDFPADVPIYPGAKLTQIISANTLNVLAESPDSVDRISDYYEKQLPSRGWTVALASRQEKASQFAADKDHRSILVLIGEGDGKTTLQVSISTKSK